MAHTPGPWWFTPALPRCVYAGDSIYPFCVGRTDVPGISTPEATANAMLMAAAPQLLEALKWAAGMAEEAIAVRESGDDPEDTPEIIAMHREYLDAARAAIYKAEGR